MEGLESPDPLSDQTPLIRPDACLRPEFLHRQDRKSPRNWLMFLMKRALHFATKLNYSIKRGSVGNTRLLPRAKMLFVPMSFSLSLSLEGRLCSGGLSFD